MPRLQALFLLLAALLTLGCSKASAQADPHLYGRWDFSGVSYQEGGTLHTASVGGTVILKPDGTCDGERVIGRTHGGLGGTFTVSGSKLTFSAESDAPYTYAIKEGEYHGAPAWVLSIDNGSMVYLLLRDRQ